MCVCTILTITATCDLSQSPAVEWILWSGKIHRFEGLPAWSFIKVVHFSVSSAAARPTSTAALVHSVVIRQLYYLAVHY